MLFIVGAVIAALVGSVAVVIVPRFRVPGGVTAGHLGCMSDQWLAEHRAANAT